MSRREPDRPVQLSVLDRLIDERPSTRSEGPLSWAQSTVVLKDAVRRDIEWLLNTRRVIEPVPEAFSEVARSVYRYGLPDISSMSADAPATRTRLAREVEEAIGIFEPRLSNVRVSPLESEEEEEAGKLRFLIEGLLRMEPTPEQVVFDTVLDISHRTFEVR